MRSVEAPFACSSGLPARWLLSESSCSRRCPENATFGVPESPPSKVFFDLGLQAAVIRNSSHAAEDLVLIIVIIKPKSAALQPLVLIIGIIKPRYGATGENV